MTPDNELPELPDSYWLVLCDGEATAVLSDPTGDIESALRDGRWTLTLDSLYGGEFNFVVSKIAGWWRETPEIRRSSYTHNKRLRDEERETTGWEGD